jgi:hypothetical protein
MESNSCSAQPVKGTRVGIAVAAFNRRIEQLELRASFAL